MLCCTHVLTDFFMHICCMAQDVEHPIISAVIAWENVATPGHRTNTFVKIEESDEENCGSGACVRAKSGTSSKTRSKRGGGHRKKKTSHGGRQHVDQDGGQQAKLERKSAEVENPEGL